MRIIGIDPGLRKVGWGVIEKNGNKISYIASGVIKTESDENLPQRILQIHHSLKQVILNHNPNQCAIEETFVNKNAASSLKLGQARGAILLSLSLSGLKIFEYSANLVKKSVAGSGHAQKFQIASMVSILLGLSRKNENLDEQNTDANDALAIAICHSSHMKPN